MSSDTTVKEFLKKRIRKGDNCVDNDLSTDDEKWVDELDAQIRNTSGQFDLAILSRRQLVRYVQTLNSFQEKQRLIEEYDIKNEELQQIEEMKLEYLTGVAYMDPELKEHLGIDDESDNSSTSSTTLIVPENNVITPSEQQAEEEKLEQPTEMSPMKLHLIKSRTPSTSNSTSLSTYKSSSQCSTPDKNSSKSSSSSEGKQTVLKADEDSSKVSLSDNDFKKVLKSSSKNTLPDDSDKDLDSSLTKRSHPSVMHDSSDEYELNQRVTGIKTVLKSSTLSQKNDKSSVHSLASHLSLKEELEKLFHISLKFKPSNNDDTGSHISISSSEATRSLPESQRCTSSSSTSLDRAISPNEDIHLSGQNQGIVNSPPSKDEFMAALKLQPKASRSSSKSSDTTSDSITIDISTNTTNVNKDEMPIASRLRPKARTSRLASPAESDFNSSSSKSISSHNTPVRKKTQCQRTIFTPTPENSTTSESDQWSPTSVTSSNKTSPTSDDTVKCESIDNDDRNSDKSFPIREDDQYSPKYRDQSNSRRVSLENDYERSYKFVILKKESQLQDNYQGSIRDNLLSLNEAQSLFSDNEYSFQTAPDNYEQVPMDIDWDLTQCKSDLTGDSSRSLSDMELDSLRSKNENGAANLDDISAQHLSTESIDQESNKSAEWSISCIPESDHLLPFARYLPAHEEPESFAALSPPQENEERISLTSLIGMNDDQLLSRCLPQDDQQLLFNFQISENNNQMSSLSLNEDLYVNEIDILDLYDKIRPPQEFSETETKNNSDSNLSQTVSLESYQSTQSDKGMSLRSGKTKPTRNKSNKLSNELADSFQTLSTTLVVKKRKIPLRRSARLQEKIISPEPAYVTLASGRKMKLRSDNVAKAAHCIYKMDEERKEAAEKRKEIKKNPSLKKSMKNKTKEEKLMNDRANILNIQTTPLGTTVYNFGRDCINTLFLKKRARRPRQVMCGMKCGKVRAYTCTASGVPICSMACYKKNMELFNRDLIQQVFQVLRFDVVSDDPEETTTEELDAPGTSKKDEANVSDASTKK